MIAAAQFPRLTQGSPPGRRYKLSYLIPILSVLLLGVVVSNRVELLWRIHRLTIDRAVDATTGAAAIVVDELEDAIQDASRKLSHEEEWLQEHPKLARATSSLSPGRRGTHRSSGRSAVAGSPDLQCRGHADAGYAQCLCRHGGMGGSPCVGSAPLPIHGGRPDRRLDSATGPRTAALVGEPPVDRSDRHAAGIHRRGCRSRGGAEPTCSPGIPRQRKRADPPPGWPAPGPVAAIPGARPGAGAGFAGMARLLPSRRFGQVRSTGMA